MTDQDVRKTEDGANSPVDSTAPVDTTAQEEANGTLPPSAESAEAPEQEQTVTLEAYSALQSKADEYMEGWQRARAEFANYKKRVDRELKDSHQLATGEVFKDMLPIVDDFERAMANVPEDLQDHPFVSGVAMIQRKLGKLLEDNNVTVIDPVGEPFDPNIHEAMAMDESDEVESGHVITTVQKGYICGDRVLRAAIVRVAR